MVGSYGMNDKLTEKAVPRDSATPSRTSAPQPPPARLKGYVPDLLRRLLQEEVRVSDAPNADLTTRELVEVLVEFCRLYALRLPSLVLVRRYLPTLVREIHGVGQSHSIIREGKHCRGFRHLEWKPCQDPEQPVE